jgi:hypothetical protein
VIVEALACGVPVAAYPVHGPLDIVGITGRGPHGALPEPIGCLNDDIVTAINEALKMDRQSVAQYGAQFCWDTCTDQFVAAVADAVINTRGQ